MTDVDIHTVHAMQRPGQDMVQVTMVTCTCVILISIKGGESQGVQTSLVKTFKTKNIKIVTFDDNKSNQVDNQIVILQIDAYYGLWIINGNDHLMFTIAG